MKHKFGKTRKSKKSRQVKRKLRKSKKTKGGVRVRTAYNNPGKAFDYFIQNSTFKILTDNSISCITLLASLKTGINSPYAEIRTKLYNQNVNNILIKFFIWGDYTGNQKKMIKDCRLREKEIYDSNIELTRSYEIENEVNIQKDLFFRSLEDDFLEPICPAILLSHSNKLSDVQKNFLKEHISKNFIERPADPNRPNKQLDAEIMEALFTYDISIIVMEYMTGYSTGYSVLDKFEKNQDLTSMKKYANIAFYKLDKLHHYGYSHNDYHTGNFMIDLFYDYFLGVPGNSIIIDFGRAKQIQQNFNRLQLLSDEAQSSGFQLQNNILDILDEINEHRIQMKQKIERDFNQSIPQLQTQISNLNFIFYRGGFSMNNNTPSVVESIQNYMNDLNKQRKKMDQSQSSDKKVYITPYNELPYSEYHEKIKKRFADALQSSGWGTKEDTENFIKEWKNKRKIDDKKKDDTIMNIFKDISLNEFVENIKSVYTMNTDANKPYDNCRSNDIRGFSE